MPTKISAKYHNTVKIRVLIWNLFCVLNHYLNQGWFIIDKIPLNSTQQKFSDCLTIQMFFILRYVAQVAADKGGFYPSRVESRMFQSNYENNGAAHALAPCNTKPLGSMVLGHWT